MHDDNRGDDFDYQSHVAQIEWDTLLADMRAAADLLHAQAGVRAVFSTGFCMGGRAAFDSGDAAGARHVRA